MTAAARLFSERGFVGTTMADVARQAGVSTPLVYAVFDSKAHLLAQTISAAVTGGHASGPLREQKAWRDIVESHDIATVLERFASIQCAINNRAWALIDAARAGAGSEPALAELVAVGARNRWRDCYEVATALQDKGGIKAGTGLETATDLIWSMCSSEIYRMLVVERGWSGPMYETWLTNVLIAELLDHQRYVPTA